MSPWFLGFPNGGGYASPGQGKTRGDVEASWRDFQCKIYWKRICQAVPPIYNTQEVQVDQTLLIGSRESFTWSNWTPRVYPIGSMCMVYSPTFTIKNQPNVGIWWSVSHPLHLVPVRAAPVHSVRVRVLCSLGAQHRASEGFLWMVHLRAAEGHTVDGWNPAPPGMYQTWGMVAEKKHVLK